MVTNGLLRIRSSGAGAREDRSRELLGPGKPRPVARGQVDGLDASHERTTSARFREDLVLDPAQAIEDRAPSLTPMQPRMAIGV